MPSKVTCQVPMFAQDPEESLDQLILYRHLFCETNCVSWFASKRKKEQAFASVMFRPGLDEGN